VSSDRRILIADDQVEILQALRLLLKPEGWAVEIANSPMQLLELVETRDFDVVLMDLNYSRATTSGAEGLALLERLRELDSTLPVVVMTAWGSVDTAVEAMRRGARDYVAKPWDNHRLLVTLDTQLSLGRALRQNQRHASREQLEQARAGIPQMIADAPAMQPVLELIDRVGPSDASVLVTGEHGTGKELVARRIHAISGRSGQLVTVNAGGLPDGVFDSELFGHVKGAFTDAKAARMGCFELADSGTLFLDEIANMPASQQAKLLRVLQTGELRRVGSSKVCRVDVRLVTATNADLHAAAATAEFREDLLYRINTVEIRVPPLRERRADIPQLAQLFLSRRIGQYGRTVQGFSEAAMDALLDHRWPGNVRELEHVVERAVLMAKDEWIAARDLGLCGGLAATRDSSAPAPSCPEGFVAINELSTLEQAEKILIQRALDRCDSNASLAAAELGLSRSAFYRRLQRHGLKANSG
jgi:DNA-binding NtrC family response regulator